MAHGSIVGVAVLAFGVLCGAGGGAATSDEGGVAVKGIGVGGAAGMVRATVR